MAFYQLTEEEILAEQLLVEAAQNDSRKFGPLYDRHFEGIFGFIFRRTDDEQVAADLVSMTFLRAMQNLQKYEFRGLPFSAWLYRIASNEVNKYYQKRKKKMVFSLEEDRFKEILDETDTENNEEQIEQLIASLRDLPTDMLMALELRFFEGKGFKEIAYILDVSESGAKMRTYRALERLRVIVEQNQEGHD